MVGDNQPYAASDATDYCIPVHAEPRGLIHCGIEVRQDLIADEAGQRAWAERLIGSFGRRSGSRAAGDERVGIERCEMKPARPAQAPLRRPTARA